MSFNQTGGTGHIGRLFSGLAELWVYLCLIFLSAAEAVPGINESHYLPKAKHLWDSRFAPGDLFLDSHDSHLLASTIAGVAAQWLPLLAVAWAGRLLSWVLLAWSWQRLRRSMRLSSVTGSLALAGWLMGVHYGHWAGEWIVGGFEAKTIAYPLVLLGLASMIEGKWHRVWLWMGGAMAWHPVVGGWAGIGAGLAWAMSPERLRTAKQQLPWLTAGAALALIGILPAISGLSGPDVVGKISAAQVHVYRRLPHHLSPQLFALERHWAATINLVVFVGVTFLYCRSKNKGQPMSSHGATLLLRVGWLAVLFAITGLMIDAFLSHSRPDIASRLLRFYWFRWSDVSVPLVSSLLLWQWLARPQPKDGRQAIRNNALNSPQQKPAHEEPNMRSLESHARGQQPSAQAWNSVGGARMVMATAVICLTLWAYAYQLDFGAGRTIPPADRLVVESVGKNAIDSDRYVDWLAVCQWIRENSPPDSLWLTPKNQQSFKWHAQRAEVVCWKDVPQDNASVIEWYHRIEACAPPRSADGSITDWTTEQLLQLSSRYGFRWVLIDRSYQAQPPALEIMYPVIENGRYVDNRSFAVMHIPDSLLRK